MDIVSGAAVRVAVGLEGTDVAVGGGVVVVDVDVDVDVAVGGAEVGVRVLVEVGGATVGVNDGPVAVGVRVGVGSGVAPCLISKERTDDQAPFIPPAVRARTRHQKRRSLVKVCVVWVWVRPV